MRVNIFIFFLLVSLANGAEVDLSVVPCRTRSTPDGGLPNNIEEFQYGTNDMVCELLSSSIANPTGNSVGMDPDWNDYCKFGYTAITADLTATLFMPFQVPVAAVGYPIDFSNGEGDLPSAFPRKSDDNINPTFTPYYFPGEEYKIKVASNIFGGVAKRLYASSGEILSSSTSSSDSTGVKNGLCFDVKEITTEEVTFTWKAPKVGTGKVFFQPLVGTNTATNANMIRFKNSCTDFVKNSSSIGCSNANCCINSSIKSCCAADDPSNHITPSDFFFVSKKKGIITIDEGFVVNPSELGAGIDGALLATIIICCVVFSIIITIVFFFKKKKQPINTENYGEGDDDKKNDIETEQNNQRTPGAAVAPIAINKKNGKDRSWIQRVARRANEFGRQVPENIQIESEVYDDFVDTFMTVVLWILLIGVLIFTIVDEYTSPGNMSVAFCSEDRASYCNRYYKHSELSNCGGEAGDSIGQADERARTSMCGLRSDGDHLLSILTNYGALSGLVTALCRYIANTWKGCRRKKLERTTQI